MAKKIRIIPELDESKLRQQLDKIENQKEKIHVEVGTENIDNADNSIKRLNNTVSNSNTVFGKLKSTIGNTFSAGKLAMTGYLAVLNEINKAGKNAKQTTQEIDKAITDLSVATNMSRESVKGLIKDYNIYAKQLSSTTTQITSAADDYLRAGKTMNEAQVLIKDSIMLSKLGKLEAGNATENLLAVMNGYEMSVNEVGKALDVMVALDMEAATSSGDIATALKYCASSADVAGLSFNKLAAMITTVQDKTQQSAETIGTFMNTLLSRYRNVKIGQFVNDDGEDLSEVETILGSLDIKLRKTNQEFREFETVIEEVAQSWKQYSSVQQAAIAKAFSGTRQQNRFLALMEGYNKTLELTEVAANSAGTAVDKFNNSYINSLEAKENTLQASFESMIMDSDFNRVYAGILDATTALIDFINQTNALKGALRGLAATGIVKAFLSIRTGINEAYISLNQFQNAINIVKKTSISTQSFERLLALTNSLSASQMKLVLSSQNLTVEQKKQIITNAALSEKEKALLIQTYGLTTAETGLTAATTTMGNAFKALWNTLLANPLIMITALVSAATMAWQTYKNHLENIRQATEEAASTYKDAASSVEDYASQYQELRNALIAAKGNEEETYNIKKQLLDLQTELNDKFGDEYGKLNLVTDAYKDQTEAIREYNKEAARTYLNENQEGIENASREMTRNRSYNLSDTGISEFTDEGKALKEIAEKYIDKGISISDDANGGTFKVVLLDVDTQAAYDTINDFENDLRRKARELGDEALFDDVLKVSSSALNDVKDVIDDNMELYKSALEAEIITDDGKGGKLEVYENLKNAVEEYNEAVLNSDDIYNDEDVAKAKANLDVIKAAIQGNEEEWGKYSVVVNNVLEQADTKMLDFYNTLKNDTTIQNLMKELDGLTATELQAVADARDSKKIGGLVGKGISVSNDYFVPEINTFDGIIEKAIELGVCMNDSAEETQKLIDLMIALGAVEDDISPKSAESNKALFSSFDGTALGKRLDYINSQFEAGEISFKDYFDSLRNEINNVDFSAFTNSIDEANAASQQFFTDSMQQTANGLSDLISKFDAGSISVSEYLEGYKSIANTLSTLTDELQENSASWDQNGNAMSNAAYNALDNTQTALDDAISTIESYQDSIYSLEQIMSGAVEAGTDDFTAHAQVIAEDLADIVASGGQMADEIANTLGTTTAEIASSMSENVSNQSLAAQAITENTNAAISDMATSVGELFDTLGNAISNFKVDISFGIKNISMQDVDMGLLGTHKLPKVDFALEASGESLSAIGSAISSFGKSVASNITPQMIELPDFSFKGDKEYTPDAGILDNYNKKLDNLKNSQKGAGSATKGANKAIEEQKKAAEEAKEALQGQIDAIDDLIKAKEKEIDALDDEIDKIKEAAEARKRDMDLQKAQYELARAENQRPKLLYTEEKGMIYVPDTDGIREKREKITELQEDAQIASLEKQKDLINDEIKALQEQKELIKEMMEESSKYYENLIKQMEDAGDKAGKAAGGIGSSIGKIRDNINNDKTLSYYIWTDKDDFALTSAQSRLIELNRLFQEQPEKYKELRDQVALFVNEFGRLKETREVTEKFKNSLDALVNSDSDYLGYFQNVVSDVEGRIETTSNYSDRILETIKTTSDGINELYNNADRTKQSATEAEEAANKSAEETSKIVETASNILKGAGDTSKYVSESVSDATESIGNLTDLVTDIDNSTLKATDGIKYLDEISAQMSSSVGSMTDSSSENFRTMATATVEMIENMGTLGESATVIAKDMENLGSSMAGLESAKETVSSVVDESNDQITTLDEKVNSISDSVSSISDSCEGIHTLSDAFTTLGEAITGVTTALGLGEDDTVGGLVSALKSINEMSLEGEGGGIISQFNDLKTAVENVSSAVSGVSGGSSGVEGGGSASMEGSGMGGASDSLTGAIDQLKQKADETLGSGGGENGSEDGGEGVIGKFSLLKEAVDLVTSAIGTGEEEGGADEDSTLISALLSQYTTAEEIIPQEKALFEDLLASIEACVRALNEMKSAMGGVSGISVSPHAEGTVGKAFADGYNGLPHAEKNALVSEYGQQEMTVLPNGKTVITEEPTMMDLPKGTTVFNEKQTKKILDGKIDATGNAFAGGTSDGEIVLADGQILRPIRPGDRAWELQKAFEPLLKSIEGNLDILASGAMMEHQRQMEKMVSHMNAGNVVTNNNPSISIGDINVTCPGVTSQEVMREVGDALGKQIGHLSQRAIQEAYKR